MKNGLLIYQTNLDINIFNIGDYIQSLAASQFFERTDVYINREQLDIYNGENVKLIMNGWFMHSSKNWPPSSKIKPLFVAFHLNSLAKNELLSEESIKYFKLQEPIGCRDYKTVKLLEEKGVKAYFSACMTLTLGEKYKNNSKNNKVFFVDPFYYFSKFKILFYISTLVLNFKRIKKISFKENKNTTIKNLIHTAAFYRQYNKIFDKDILINSEYINHEIPDTFESENEKFDYAKYLLSEYSQAQFVVTSRIHCALPCLALDTPVLYTDDLNQLEVSYCRLDGIRDLFNTIKIDKDNIYVDNQPSKINFKTKLSNKKDYIKYRDKLIETCKKFVNQ